MSEFGVKIKNIKAGTLFEYNLGVRDKFDYTDAMFNNSLFSDFIIKQGLSVYKGESTRDIICIEFDFGSKSYDEKVSQIQSLICNTNKDDIKLLNRLKDILEQVHSNKDKFIKLSMEEIRDEYYQNGVTINYVTKNKNGDIKKSQSIHYKMLFRTPSKAKVGQAIFINEKFYDIAYDWLTMSLGNKMNKDKAKIVEMSAYAPLTTSTIIDKLHIPINDIVILKDQDSFFETLGNIVEAEEYFITKKVLDYEKTEENRIRAEKEGKVARRKFKKIKVPTKKCIVKKGKINIKNTMWDGMGLIDNSVMPAYSNGMLLLRNHFFKMCGFRTNMQLFFKEWCDKNNFDYSTYKITDMFGNEHYLKDIKVITTDNSIKWKKFTEIMGENPYKYWCQKVENDNCMFGVVKTDHKSKLGNVQQMSYQMVNTLPCDKQDIEKLAKYSVEYVELIKNNNDEFEKFLRKNANEINHYEMMADLYAQNKNFANSKWFRTEKSKIIFSYVEKLRKGKIMINADNLTVCGNPYALLLYSVGEDWTKDPTLNKDNGVIQCYTTRFKDGEFLCAIRNPHNSPNNVAYMKNIYSNEIQRYFPFSENIIAVNCIETDVQDRMNGEDFDSDFNFVTNNAVMVECAKKCYEQYPTIVNQLKESSIVYPNTKLAYSEMDNKFSKSRLGIGWSSNLAQLAMTYYWTNPSEELYDNFVILSVLAQVIIDGCKREYEINGMEEIDRIQKMPCMQMYKYTEDNKKIKCDYPKFMKYTKDIQYTKDGFELPFEVIKANKKKIYNRINYELDCPMNWLEDVLDNIKPISSTNTIPTNNFFVKMEGKPNHRQISKIRKLVDEYDCFVKTNKEQGNNVEKNIEAFDKLLNDVSKVKVGNVITINRLIESALGLENNKTGRPIDKSTTKYTRKMLNVLYKTNREKFLSCFMVDDI